MSLKTKETGSREARRGAARLTLYFSKYPRYLMTLTHTSSVEVPRKMLHTS